MLRKMLMKLLIGLRMKQIRLRKKLKKQQTESEMLPEKRLML